MKVIEIFGENYFGRWNEIRIACRAIVVKDFKVLLSYETISDTWMLPGGGLEDGESDSKCCVREVAEETGVLVEPSECFLEIDEYYENVKFVSRYFKCELIGSTETKLTEQEKEVGMEPRWLPLDEIKAIFAEHKRYAATDEMRRGLYLREYTALCEFENL